MNILTEEQGSGNVSPITGRTQSSELQREIPGPDYFVKVPDGEYIAEFIGSVGFFYRGRGPKVALWFVISDGSCTGERVAAFCNVRSIEAKRGQRIESPRFTVGWGADLTTYLGTLFPDWYSPKELPTAVPLVEMMERGIVIRTRTVIKSHSGQERPDAFKNSVVDAVLGWAE